MMCKKAVAEGIGTFWMVLAGCGVLAFAGDIGTLGIALAFGLSILTMGFALGAVSGGHFNPAITIGLVVGNRFEAKDAIGYIIAQVLGAILAAWVIGYIGEGHAGFSLASIANGFDSHSPGGFSQHAVMIAEIIMAAMLMFIVMGVADRAGTHAPLAVGFAVALIYLIMLGVDNGGINPARATGPAIIVQDWAVDQLWLFWVAPIIGAIIGAVVYRKLDECK